jgi:hypothetical protein
LLCAVSFVHADNFEIKNATKHELCLVIDFKDKPSGQVVVIGPHKKAELPSEKMINNLSILSLGKYKKFDDIMQNGSRWKSKIQHVYNISGPIFLKGKVIVHKTTRGLEVD